MKHDFFKYMYELERKLVSSTYIVIFESERKRA